MSEVTHAVIWVEGLVQGVGFRWWVQRRATELGLLGSATNLFDGRVQVDAQGPDAAVQTLISDLTGPPGPRRRPGRVSSFLVEHRPVNPRLKYFDIG